MNKRRENDSYGGDDDFSGILDLPELWQETRPSAGPASLLPLRVSREEGEGEAAVRR